MRFRTEITPPRGLAPITHGDRLLMLGSCFTSEIGAQLDADGFCVTHNPMGPLYNPESIAQVVERALDRRRYTEDDLTIHEGIFHCLDFQSKYQGADAADLLSHINHDFDALSAAINGADLWIITLGTARAFALEDKGIVGNCHKLPADRFVEGMLDVDDIVERWLPLVEGRRVIFTVSPIRHLADGLHGNQLSKARLLLAVERLQKAGADYFPSYEILLDDLRDYRFYAADMKHPSPTAVDYIYSIWSDTYFTPETRRLAARHRQAALASAHRPIIT